MKYNYKNCQSLFGYSAEVHIRSKGTCQLCGCGGEPYDFDLWRQLTIEHLIGKSQGGYLKQIRESVKNKFPNYRDSEIEEISLEINSINTVSACQFCNSTTSRDKSHISMSEIITHSGDRPDKILNVIKSTCQKILESKRRKVEWKLEAVKEAFQEQFVNKV